MDVDFNTLLTQSYSNLTFTFITFYSADIVYLVQSTSGFTHTADAIALWDSSAKSNPI